MHLQNNLINTGLSSTEFRRLNKNNDASREMIIENGRRFGKDVPYWIDQIDGNISTYSDLLTFFKRSHVNSNEYHH